MKDNKMPLMRKLCVVFGACLLAAALVTLSLWQWNIYSSRRQAENCVDTLRTLLPDVRDAGVEERRDNTMSVLSVNGTDFLGIIEIPRHGSVLPVGAQWGSVSKYPCRFSGSVYDKSIVVGATTQDGQYDFYRDLTLGDVVVFTDAEGNRFTYKISSMRYEKHADKAALEREQSAFTLFIKNVYSFDYLVVYCDTPY